jgi:hypothetical protein
MAFSREVVEGLQVQGANETVTYTIDVANWTDTPASPSATVLNLSAGSTDVTADTTTGSESVSDTTITLPRIHSLTNGDMYRVNVEFTSGNDTLELFILIRCGD